MMEVVVIVDFFFIYIWCYWKYFLNFDEVMFVVRGCGVEEWKVFFLLNVVWIGGLILFKVCNVFW